MDVFIIIKKTLSLLLILAFTANFAGAGILFVKSQGITLTGADGITLTGADGITLTGADGITFTGADGITLTGADGITFTGADGITFTGADSVIGFRADGSSFILTYPNGITFTGADGITLTGADGITFTGADGITFTGADNNNETGSLTLGLQGLDPALAIALNSAADDSNLNAVVVFYQYPTENDLNRLRQIGILGGTLFRVLPMITVSGTRSQIAALSRLPQIRSIYGNRTLSLDSDPFFNKTLVQKVLSDQNLQTRNNGLPVSGNGVTVAVLDTGVNA